MAGPEKGALLLAGCVVLTLVSPVVSTSCRRGADGAVGCRVTRHAMGVLPFWWSRLDRVVDATHDFTRGGQVRGRSGRKAIVLSELTTTLWQVGTPPVEWTTHGVIGADPGTVVIAVDDLVAGKRTEPYLAWQANIVTVFTVFVLSVPFAAAMLSRTVCERRQVARDRWLSVIERTYVTALVAGCLIAAVVWWGSVPRPLAALLGLPTG